MSLPRRIFSADEELGKKDDDHFRKTPRLRRPFLTSWRLPRRRRVCVLIIGIIVCCLFLTYLPQSPSDDEFDDETPVTYPSYPVYNGVSRPKGPPPVADRKRNHDKHYFNGPVRFYTLAQTLYSIRGFMGYNRDNKIVLFAAANQKCLSGLLPLACEMSGNKLNRVHVALMGRDDISVGGIQEANRYNESECSLVWHDARPDFGPWSTDMRMEASVKSALGHIYNVLRPRIIVTHESREESFFVKAIKAKVSHTRITHIGLQGRASDFKWITRLDSKALAVWNKVQVELLVHATPASSGSLLRLLKSLQGANYFGPAPGLTIELPFDVDTPLVEFLRDFTWPPHTDNRQFTLRRRIMHNMSPQEAAVRSIDAFYPQDPQYSHVLVLSPQTELAPSFYHLTKYSLLKYKYSMTDVSPPYHLLGISLELPSSKPTDGSKFSPPNMEMISVDHEQNIPVFLWQAPNSNAALYFGDKWVEFHSFLSNRFAPSLKMRQMTHPKVILGKYPSWMEYMLEFIRARGYYLLYPAFASEDDLSLATVHNELFHLPEEHSSMLDETHEPIGEEIQNPQQTLFGSSTAHSMKSGFAEDALSESPSISNLLDAFPGRLPQLSSLLVLSPSGVVSGPYDLASLTEEYLKAFRRSTGGCSSENEPPEFVHMSTDDLFCLERDEEDRL
ncbi:hypothetical protein PRK78_006431 [Emydomyces testavorans]|uniref:Glycosyltransferase 2 n=1 Tax=Emydomyces testavorans TaxID=2070801 RepID=A0AAF0IKU1_9EURO|nr:hypothetical protein PRK78_006431 [Emydomyces testavorans]